MNSVLELNEVIALLDKLAPRPEPLGLFPGGIPIFSPFPFGTIE